MTLSSSGTNPPPDGVQTQAEDLSLQEIIQRFSNRWVAMIVTKRDKNLQPSRGRVIADDIDRYRLRQSIVGQKDVCIFFAGEPAYPLIL